MLASFPTDYNEKKLLLKFYTETGNTLEVNGKSF